MKSFIKKNRILLIGILIPVGILIATYFAFAFNGFIPQGLIARSDWLMFWGGFLAFSGTAFLGYVAAWQTKQANDISKRLLAIEEVRLCCTIVLGKTVMQPNTLPKPHVQLSNEASAYDSNNELCMSISNSGDVPLQRIKIMFPLNKIFSSHITLASGVIENLRIPLPVKSNNNKRVQVVFTSCHGKETYGYFEVEITHTGGIEIKNYQFSGILHST